MIVIDIVLYSFYHIFVNKDVNKSTQLYSPFKAAGVCVCVKSFIVVLYLQAKRGFKRFYFVNVFVYKKSCKQIQLEAKSKLTQRIYSQCLFVSFCKRLQRCVSLLIAYHFK